jgi:hypothetical protein
VSAGTKIETESWFTSGLGYSPVAVENHTDEGNYLAARISNVGKRPPVTIPIPVTPSHNADNSERGIRGIPDVIVSLHFGFATRWEIGLKCKEARHQVLALVGARNIISVMPSRQIS